MSRLNKEKRTARECPYLDTVNRQALDFDFEKCCSVTLSPHNCYACLVRCGDAQVLVISGRTLGRLVHSVRRGDRPEFRKIAPRSF